MAHKTVPVEAVRSDTAVRSENAVLAAEVWRRMLDFHMAHLRHMDHSPRFWAEVERQCPDYKRLRARLFETDYLYRSF